MLSITNDQHMGELELLLTPNQLSVTAPAGREPVLNSACKIYPSPRHGTSALSPKAPTGLAFLAY